SYIDSSSLLKTLWEEPESPAVREAIASEQEVVISTLAELETEVQLRAKWLSGGLTKTRCEAYRKKLASFREPSPFEFRDLSGAKSLTAAQESNTHEPRPPDGGRDVSVGRSEAGSEFRIRGVASTAMCPRRVA